MCQAVESWIVNDEIVDGNCPDEKGQREAWECEENEGSVISFPYAIGNPRAMMV